MKHVIVPVDFSKTSDNAVKYAIAMAEMLNAEVTLMHVFSLPVPTADAALPIVPIQEISEAAESKMKKYFNEVQLSHPLIKLNYFVCGGFVVDEIANYCALHPCDLLVMGITGGGKFKEKFIGSTALAIARNSGFAVLIVPTDTVFKKPENLVFATDFDIENEEAIANEITNFSHLFGSKLDILTVMGEDQKVGMKSATTGIKLHQSLESISHDFKMVETNDIADGIHKYISTHRADWLITIPKKHTIFGQLFHESITNKLAFHSHIPILAINIKNER